MSDAARRSNAIMRRLAADRKSKEYKTARKRIAGSWADREKGQGGLRHVKGPNSKKADAARAANAVKGAKTRTVGNPNKDGSTPLKGRFKVSGDKGKDAIKITQLDRGSPERKAAVKAFEAHYGGGSKAKAPAPKAAAPKAAPAAKPAPARSKYDVPPVSEAKLAKFKYGYAPVRKSTVRKG